MKVEMSIFLDPFLDAKVRVAYTGAVISRAPGTFLSVKKRIARVLLEKKDECLM